MGRGSSKKKRKFKENTFKEDEIKDYLVKVKKFAISEDDKVRMRSLQDSTSSSKITHKVEDDRQLEEQESEPEEFVEDRSAFEVCEEADRGDLHRSQVVKEGEFSENDELSLGESGLASDQFDLLDKKMAIYVESNRLEDDLNNTVTSTDEADETIDTLGKSSKSTGDISAITIDSIQPDYKTVLVDRDSEIDLKRRKLPCCMMEQEIVDSIRNHDVVLVTGDTGTGKSTQIPQFLYENGFCIDDKIIGITQTRRVACMAIAKQIGLELNSRELIGYQIRYDKSYNEKLCKIKLMTDGILINELKRDILLSKYSVVIIDEAHERKINSDVLIGLLSQIVKLRRKKYMTNKEMLPLKLVIMSATIRKEDFMENKLFENIKHVHIPSEQPNYTIHYNKKTPINYLTETKRKILQIHKRLPPGSVLVFLTGKQELYDLKRLLLASRINRAGVYNNTTVAPNDATTTDGCTNVATDNDNNMGSKTFVHNKDLYKEDVKDDDEIFDLDEDECLDGDEEDELTLDSDDKFVYDVELKKATEGYSGFAEKLKISTDEQDLQLENEDKVDAGDEEWEEYELKALTDNYKKSIDCKWLGSDGSGRLNVKIFHASQTNYQQMNCFMLPEDNERIVILSTNVAETSITIPNIRYVVDSGKEKRKVFNNDKECENFEVFNISKSSANQRAGRCGRLGHGHCYRLYTNSVFENLFPDQSPVEILESNLCSVALLLVAMGINPHNFTYLARPPRGHIDNAIRTLVVLGIIEADQREKEKKVDFNYMFNDPFLLTADQLPTTYSDISYSSGSKAIKANYVNDKLRVTKLGRCVSLIPLEPRYAKMVYCVLSKNIKSVNFTSVSFLIVAILSFNGPFFIHSNMSSDTMVDQLGGSDKVPSEGQVNCNQAACNNGNGTSCSTGNGNTNVGNVDNISNSSGIFTSNKGRNWTNDLEKYVWLLCGYSKAENKVDFCNSFGVNPRALTEVFLQANQIYQIINVNFPALSVRVDFEHLVNLRAEQSRILAECVVEGLVDRVAVGARHLGAEYTGESGDRSGHRSYRCEKMGNAPVYLPNNYPRHECVAYNYLIGEERIKMCNVVPVNPTHLATINSVLVVSRQIERNPVPYYENGSVWGYVRRYYEPLNYFLTTAKKKLPGDHPLVFRVFSVAFCYGQIYPELSKFSDLLVVGKGDFFSRIGKRSVLQKFIKKLHKFRVYNRNTFESVYKQDKKFLFNEYKSLLSREVPQLEEVYQDLPVGTN